MKFDYLLFFLKQKKLYFIFLIFLAIIVGILESLNVALIYPILSNSLGIDIKDNYFLNLIFEILKFIPINDELIKYCLLFVIFAILISIIKLIYYYLSINFISDIVLKSKLELFDKCSRSDYQFFIDNKQGSILYKVSESPNRIATIFQIIMNIFIELFLSISIFTVLISMSWKLVFILSILGILYFYLIKYLSIKISFKAGKKKLKSSEKEKSILNEYTNGIKQIKVFDTFTYWKNLLDKTLNVYWFHHRKDFFWKKIPDILIWLIMYLSLGVTIIFIKLKYPGDFIDILPMIGSFAFGIFMILPKLSKFGSYRMNLMHHIPDLQVVYKMLRDNRYSKIKNGKKTFSDLETSIEFKNVNFSYDNNEILKNFNMKIEKNKITSLIGHSGTGKSTIVNLILRLYDIEKGNILINNIDIKKYDIFTFLKKIGYVSQDIFMYNASIKDNITFGENYSNDEIVKAAKLANANKFIEKLPDKYDTIIGDRGVKLSGGEKQRISIARAIIRKPEILIFDEATSSLDCESEKEVQKAIENLSKNMTILIITHRLSAIKNSDIIYYLYNGKIVEKGTHNELLKNKQKYWELYKINN